MTDAQKKTTATPESDTQMHFTADVSRLLDIVAHALYSNRDVFLRELISNAADACDRLRYETVRDPGLLKKAPAFHIRITKDTDTRTVTVLDNGIGMTREELVENLGTIARSGTAALVQQVKDSGNDRDKLSLIGQFGVGFYASFMVADTVMVISRKAGTNDTWAWESDGRTGYTVRPATTAEAKQLTAPHGTAITLHINDQSSDYLVEEKLKQVVQTWSDHISIPIYVGAPATTDGEEAVNRASALWMRAKADITPEQYTEFYHHIGHGMDAPLLTSHWKAEGTIEFNALLFTPTLRPWDLYDPTRRHAVRLYVKRVFITDDCEGLMYPWLRFVRGVIDSEDLPLNISREMLQHNPVITRMRTAVAKRILADLDKLARDDEPAFGTFWGQFGAVLKEGLYDAPAHRDELLKITRFYSTHGDELTSLEDYIARMKDGQDRIYYISGENLSTLRNSPQIEGFKARGLEVLFFTDTIDDFWLQNVLDYKGHSFQSVTKGTIDLSRFDAGKPADADNSKDQDTASASTDAHDAPPAPALDALLALFKEELSEDIGDIRTTGRLTDSPVCLVAADNEVDLRMERVLRIHQKYEPQSRRILEVNPRHPLIRALAHLPLNDKSGSDADTARNAAHMLLDQARIIQGEPVPDPAAFARRLALFMQKGLPS